MTYRERRERRAARLREWADKRRQKSDAARDSVDAIAGQIPLGQPILVGHHSERRHRRDLERIHDGMRRSIEHQEKASSMDSRADNIEAQLAGSIYSDDPDAISRLEERLAGLEAERDRIKAYNASCRRGQPDESLLSEQLREDLAKVRRSFPEILPANGALPAYHLSNLSGNIKRNRDRLEELRRRRSGQ